MKHPGIVLNYIVRDSMNVSIQLAFHGTSRDFHYTEVYCQKLLEECCLLQPIYHIRHRISGELLWNLQHWDRTCVNTASSNSYGELEEYR